jgi:hypothetical protein
MCLLLLRCNACTPFSPSQAERWLFLCVCLLGIMRAKTAAALARVSNGNFHPASSGLMRVGGRDLPPFATILCRLRHRGRDIHGALPVFQGAQDQCAWRRPQRGPRRGATWSNYYPGGSPNKKTKDMVGPVSCLFFRLSFPVEFPPWSFPPRTSAGACQV